MSILANRFIILGYSVDIISKSHQKPFYDLDRRISIVFPKKVINYSNVFDSFWGRILVYIEIFNYFRKQRPDVVIPFGLSTNGVIILLCKVLKLRTIASEHTNYKVGLNLFFVRFIKKYIYPLANTLTVLTEKDAEYYRKYMDNVVVMPNPLSLKPISEYDNFKRNDIILAVGDVSRWHTKGFDNLLNIFSDISGKYFNWKLIIVGGGDNEYLSAQVKHLNLEERVCLFGPTKEVQVMLRSAKIFALTSRHEGLPMVLIEAMSQGLPCIAYDCFTGPGDIITNGADGVLVEDQNTQDFHTKLSMLIEDPDMRAKLASNALQTCNKYLPDNIITMWQKLIEEY